jgi:phosphate transport system permease protein
VLRLLTEKQKDRAATVVIRVGGILVILVVVAIVVNIGLQALPLFRSAKAGPIEALNIGGTVLAAGSDPRREQVWSLSGDGTISFLTETDRAPLRVFDEPVQVAAADHEIHGLISVLTTTGQLAVGQVRFRDTWIEDVRTTRPSWRSQADPFVFTASDDSTEAVWQGVTANADSDGSLLAAAWTENGKLAIAHWDADDESWQELVVPAGLRATRVAVAEELGSLAVVDSSGRLRLLRLPSLEEIEVRGVTAPVAAVRFLIGGGSLVAAGQDGSVGVMLTVPYIRVENRSDSTIKVSGARIPPGEDAVVPDDEVGSRMASRQDVQLGPAAPVAQLARQLPGLSAAATVIAPSHRRHGFAVGAADGTMSLYYSTSARRLLTDRWSDRPVTALAIDPKSDGAVLADPTSVLRRSIDNPHPEVSLRTLFLPVWYEGYASPKWVWQSTGGSDSFEPKMSLWPLIFGTLKATLYAMLLSVPLALMAAIYVSQLAPSWLQSTFKPTLELMAAVPSVVVGFLAALWLAPRLEAALFASLLVLFALPLAVLLALALWRAIPPTTRRRLPGGGELIVLALSCVAVFLLVSSLADPIESWLFNGDFQRYLFTEWGIRYEQRNSLVVGLALGFAVIPVIFTIAEDACSAVPKNLVTASRALGATRWQTAIRLVVPAASPGLFAAVMLGLGRAVGETMIVLMAAGNTPLLDLSAFNGMRTMSAAIAVEIPEAPVGGTLFRVLFLTGTLLFAFTLILTTAADLVGSYLRRRYARF